MDRLTGTLLVLIAATVVLPSLAAAAQAVLPALLALLVVLLAVRWLA
jgi:hypothetical protein